MASINVKSEKDELLFTVTADDSITIGYSIPGNISDTASKYGIKLNGENIIVPSTVTKCKIGSQEAKYPVTITTPTEGMNVVLLGLISQVVKINGKPLSKINGKKVRKVVYNNKEYII